ncbi:hypothetical protein [Leptonema illini]|uniref:Uncharacterized protein n=1 Tax=Leptonema illini DSM 21528 TaxID=929563 RepID=H2CBB5_9LEPT|nr:hypothetical protein [Leptonema illini]EHQ06286.1 hypothetical protein Lepil_1600 [Leptonema illini DSM 21528]
MKQIWEQKYSHGGKAFRLAIVASGANLRVQASNMDGRPALFRFVDEAGKEKSMEVCAYLDWIMQEELVFDGRDPKHWLSVLVNKVREMIELAIDNNRSVNL